MHTCPPPDDFARLAAELQTLSVFSALLKHPLVRAFRKLLKSASRCERVDTLARAWAHFTRALWAESGGAGGVGFCDIVYRLVRTDENAWTLAVEHATVGGTALAAAAACDLAILARVAAFDFSRLAALAPHDSRLRLECAALAAANADAADAAAASTAGRFVPETFAQEIRAAGAGVAGLHTLFYWQNGLCPARLADEVRLANLRGYEAARELVVENTRRFLDGGAANNLLLYGDRGTGKSATVKAVCNDFAPRGLRLVQIGKDDFPFWRTIFTTLARRAQK
ncbi:MAG: ATP-binding protein, partial [Spirochaetaceae bacterium]|nr:ATP-binding protein [Spirochaetaceae bacterium]